MFFFRKKKKLPKNESKAAASDGSTEPDATKAKLPPPNRSQVRRLSLKTAMNAAAHHATADMKPMPKTEDIAHDSKTTSAKQQEMEAHLLELQAEIIVREDQVAQIEKKLEARERGLNEREALLEAHMRIAESTTKQESNGNGPDDVSASQSEAIRALQTELEKQEASLLRAQNELRERERYIEQCEQALAERALSLDSREAELGNE